MKDSYAVVFSIPTGWIMGRIENHTARPLMQHEVREACVVLNELAEKHGTGPVSPNIPTQAEPVFFFKEGDLWCAVRRDFVDFQESHAGFGLTQAAAMSHLEIQEGK